MKRSIRLIDAPSNLGLRPPSPGKEPGVKKMPDALRAHDLLARLKAVDGGRVAAPPYSFDPPGEIGIRNAGSIASYSLKLADALTDCLDAGDFPLVLGGDCSILLGSLLALRERGAYGLLFIDGHPDLLTPSTSYTGGAAGMDLALAMGYGPAELNRLNGHYPLVDAGHVVLFGYQDGDFPYPEPRPSASYINLRYVQRHSDAVRTALAYLEDRRIDGFWIHCDLDVLSSNIMPAVDSPDPGGLSYAALTDILKTALAHPLCVGMQVTIFDPDLDPDGSYARDITTMLVEAFR